MRKSSTILVAAAALGVAAAAVSCQKSEKFLGQWTAETPVDITAAVPAADRATMSTSIFFGRNDSLKIKQGGNVSLTATIDLTQVVDNNAASVDDGYEVSVAATASIAGTWRYKDNDDDELILALNPSSLQVQLDPNGVTFTQNLLTGMQQPQVDSLTAATARLWKSQIYNAVSAEFDRYRHLDDVKVGRDGILKLELGHPDTDLYFVRN